MTVSVAVIGPAGRMGIETCRTLVEAGETALVAGVDPRRAGRSLGEVVGVGGDAPVVADVDGLATLGVEVAVDFAPAEAGRDHLPRLAAAGIHAVVGTSGYGPDDLEALRSAFTSSNCIVAPNFAIGAVLASHLAALAAPWFDTAEIIEFHHDGKADAPSGTAMHTAERLAEASADWAPDPTRVEVLEGSRGGLGPAGIRVHAVRMRGMVASQEVVLGTTGQTLTLRHDTIDRSSFMPGVLLAVRSVADRPGVTVGLDALLGL
jgi:4-hydroxy-tetrahydrodipicolinate reductase